MAENQDLSEHVTALTDKVSKAISSLSETLTKLSEQVKATGGEGGAIHEIVANAQKAAKDVATDFSDLRKKLTK